MKTQKQTEHAVDKPMEHGSLSRAEILDTLKKENVQFLRLMFTDISGTAKNVEVPKVQFEKALDGQIMFDGSSIEGFVRIEESDMILVPDLNTFRIFPWNDENQGRNARIICDVHTADGTAFEGCPRGTLKRQIARASELGYQMMAGVEAEFFLFELEDGRPTTQTHDSGGYFDMAPIDRGEPCRRAICNALHAMGLEVEASHHEVAAGQHEIDFRYGDALDVADNLMTFRLVVRKISADWGLHATFMPKPVFGINGSGMHCHQSLFEKTSGKNAFYGENDEWQLSEVATSYIAGLLGHAKGLCALTNPIVNSYKRLVPGYEAPTHIAWSEKNRSPLCRVPARRGVGTRVELRMPDPTCNPYLALTGMLAAGLDGVQNKKAPPAPVNKNLYTMSQRERSKHKVESLPANLSEAVTALEKDKVLGEALGEHILSSFVSEKRSEWQEYIAQVHDWEIKQYLRRF